MTKHYVEINGKIYIFVFKENQLLLFEIINGKPQKVNTNELKDKNEMIQNSLTGMLKIIEEDINKKIETGKYNSLNEVTKDIKDRVGCINITQLNMLVREINFETNEEYKTMLKHLSDKFIEMDLERKKQVVEQQIDVDLRTLFAENGIKEYEISPSKSVITYEKDGIIHTLNNTDPNSTIYDVVLKSINLDKMNSREELDNEISRIMDLESQHKYQKNRTVSFNELEDYKQNIAEFLQKEYGYTNIKGIEPEDSNIIDGGWIAELNDGNKIPIFAIRNENGLISVTLGREKQIDSIDEPSTQAKQIDKDSKTIEKEINSQTREEQLTEIYKKLFNEEELTEEEKEIIEIYRNNEEEFNKLSKEAREMCKEIIEIYDKMQMEKYPERYATNEKVLKLGEMPKPTDESGTIYIGVVTFLSGLITGIFVFMFFKMFL